MVLINIVSCTTELAGFFFFNDQKCGVDSARCVRMHLLLALSLLNFSDYNRWVSVFFLVVRRAELAAIAVEKSEISWKKIVAT